MSMGREPTEDLHAADASEAARRWNVPTPTLGGRQFWGDVAFFRGWQIQHNVISGHYRLLDPGDIRRAWGARDECEQALEEIKRRQQLPAMEGRAVIVIHGIARSSRSFDALREKLEEEGATVVGFDYPSTRVTIEDSAEYLHQVIESLEGIERIDVVAHSMGGLVFRTWLRDHQDPRLHRMVMLAVPNRGARMANIMQPVPIYKWIFGPAGQQLVEDPEGLIASLPTPDFEFAIISGARGTESGWNPLIKGDDDGTISVACTLLPGAADTMTVPALHSFLMFDDAVVDAVCRFLDSGCLHADGTRRPVPASGEE